MKLYTFPIAPNPTRVKTYLGEKGIKLEEIIVNLAEGEQHSPAHLARSPLATLPVLELDTGEYIDESLTIMMYLEDYHPDPVMIGKDPLARAKTLQTERFIEMSVLQRLVRLIHATNSPLGLPPNPGIAESESARLPNSLARLNKLIGDNAFVLGSKPTIADCTLFAAMNFAAFADQQIDEQYSQIHRWYESFKTRPSAA